MTKKELAKMLYTLASMSTSNEKELNIGEMLSKLGESGIELEMFETPTFVEKMYFPIDQWSYEVFKRKHYINDEETSFWGRYKQPVKIDPKKVMLTSWPTWLVQELEKGETFDDNGGKISFNKNGAPALCIIEELSLKSQWKISKVISKMRLLGLEISSKIEFSLVKQAKIKRVFLMLQRFFIRYEIGKDLLYSNTATAYQLYI